MCQLVGFSGYIGFKGEHRVKFIARARTFNRADEFLVFLALNRRSEQLRGNFFIQPQLYFRRRFEHSRNLPGDFGQKPLLNDTQGKTVWRGQYKALVHHVKAQRFDP